MGDDTHLARGAVGWMSISMSSSLLLSLSLSSLLLLSAFKFGLDGNVHSDSNVWPWYLLVPVFGSFLSSLEGRTKWGSKVSSVRDCSEEEDNTLYTRRGVPLKRSGQKTMPYYGYSILEPTCIQRLSLRSWTDVGHDQFSSLLITM